MKESIEKKLGMTIEKFVENLKRFYEISEKRNITLEWHPFSELSYEERDYLVDYVEENNLEIYA